MRILLITDTIGGVWVYSLELARALEGLGVETVLVVAGPSPTARQREEASRFRLVDAGLSLDWVDTNPGELRRSGDTIADIARRENVDVIQTCSAALAADADFGLPCVAVQHSCLTSWWAAVRNTRLPTDFLWRRDLVKRGLNRAEAIVAPSIAFAAETARIYDVEAPVIAVHNGRRASAASAVDQSDFVFTASRLWDEGKNVATLDRAARHLKVPFQAAGSTTGPNGSSIEIENLAPIGAVSAARLAGLLAAKPIYASAALYEPFGLSVLEAASAGCALVLSDIPTHREIWAGAAIFVPARDDDAFASAIHDLLEDPDERQQLGQLARARAQLYTPERMARGMADIYARVAQPRAVSEPSRMAGAA